MIDANGHETRWERDPAGRVLREVRADAVTDTDYTYDALGRLKTVTDPKQQVTTYTYNLDGSVGAVVYTNAPIATPSVSWTYDPAYARVATMVDGTGTTSYTYHPAGQLGAGQVATVDGPLTNDVISYTYDQLGRVVTRAINGVPLTLTYDALGRVACRSWVKDAMDALKNDPTHAVPPWSRVNGSSLKATSAGWVIASRANVRPSPRYGDITSPRVRKRSWPLTRIVGFYVQKPAGFRSFINH